MSVTGAPRYDLAAIRAHFPSLGGGIVRFDGPAGTQTPAECIEAIADYLRRSNSNSTHGAPYRGILAATRTNDLIIETHAAVADLLGADPAECILGPNMTTLSFAMSRRIGSRLRAGDEILLSPIDHDANIAPWLVLAEERDLVVRWIEPDLTDCSLNAERIAAALTPRTRVVAIGLASNAVGTLLPTATVARIGELARASGALLWVDAVHAAPHLLLDVSLLGADVLVCSAYKIYGPHLGILWGRRTLLDSLPAQSVRWPSAETPYRFETGTPAYELYAGLVGTLGYLADLGATCAPETAREGRRAQLAAAFSAIRAHESALAARFITGLRALPGCTIYGVVDPRRVSERCPTVGFRLGGIAPEEIAERCNRAGFAVWAGGFASFELMRRLGLEQGGGIVRVGIAHYTTLEEVDALIALLSAMRAAVPS